MSAFPSWLGKPLQRLLHHYPGPSSFALAALLLLSLVWLNPRFETNDDASMMLSVSGLATVAATEYLFILHALLGKCLKGLYSLHAAVPWYQGTLYAIHFLSIALLSRDFLRTKPKNLQLAGFVTFLLCINLNGLQLLQMTSTAGLAALAGGWHLFEQKRLWNRKEPLWNLLAYFVFLFSLLLRANVFILFFALFVPLVLWRAWTERKWSPLAPFVLTAILAGGLTLWEKWDTPPEWHAYYETVDNQSRAIGSPALVEKRDYAVKVIFSDYGIRFEGLGRPRPSELALRVFAEHGLHEEDVLLFQEWFLFDSEKFSPALLQSLRESARSAFYVSPIPRFGRWLTGTGQRVFLPIILLLSILSLHNAKTSTEFWLALAGAGVIWLVLVLFWRLPPRLFYPLAAFPIWIGIQPNRWTREPSRTRALVWGVLIVCALVGYQKQATRNAQGYEAADLLFAELERASAEHPGVILSYTLLPSEYLFRPSIANRLKETRLMRTGWGNHSPMNQRLLQQYGIQSAAQGLLLGQDIMLLASEKRMMRVRRFMYRHYGKSIRVEPVAKINDDLNLWKPLPPQEKRRRRRRIRGIKHPRAVEQGTRRRRNRALAEPRLRLQAESLRPRGRASGP